MKEEQKNIDSINSKRVYTKKSKKGYGFSLFALRDFRKNELVVHSFGKVLDHQTNHSSIQIDLNKHILPRKWTGKYWNHSCNPNCYVRSRANGMPSLYAMKNIKKDEEITYSYWMTELKWGKSVNEINEVCLCGEKQCDGHIYAFSELPEKIKQKYIKKGYCSNYLKKIYKK